MTRASPRNKVIHSGHTVRFNGFPWDLIALRSYLTGNRYIRALVADFWPKLTMFALSSCLECKFSTYCNVALVPEIVVKVWMPKIPIRSNKKQRFYSIYSQNWTTKKRSLCTESRQICALVSFGLMENSCHLQETFSSIHTIAHCEIVVQSWSL